MKKTRKQEPVQKLLLYLAVTTFVLLIVAFFGSNSIANETLKTFIQSITGNVASTVFAFIVIYIFITSQNIFPSVDERKITEEEFTNKIQTIQQVTQETIDTFTKSQKEAMQRFSGGKTVQELIKNAKDAGYHWLEVKVKSKMSRDFQRKNSFDFFPLLEMGR